MLETQEQRGVDRSSCGAGAAAPRAAFVGTARSRRPGPAAPAGSRSASLPPDSGFARVYGHLPPLHSRCS